MAQSKIIYGIHAVATVIQHQPENILSVTCQEKQDTRLQNLLITLQDIDVKPQYASNIKLEKLAGSSHHQGIVAIVRTQKSDEKMLYEWLQAPSKMPLLLLLEGIKDPHNLGACLRSAQALGVDWVVLPKHNAAPLNATASKVACGALELLSIVEVSNLARCITQIQELGVWVVGTALESAAPLTTINLNQPLAIVMGEEEKGLKRLTLEKCDTLANIPLVGDIASLNVSVATGICLYECLRQRLVIQPAIL